MTENLIRVDALTPTIGALIRGVDLSTKADVVTLERIYELLIKHLVIFVPDQDLTPDSHLAFAESFGELDTPHHVYACMQPTRPCPMT